MVEFATNNNEIVSTESFLFFGTKDLYLHMSFNIIKLFNATTYKQILK